MAWSLAQHYLIATALSDLTFDPRVAAWFATHPWCATEPGPKEGEVGVIYRVHRAKIEQLLSDGTKQMRAWAIKEGRFPPPELFLVDIRDIPATFAKRPSAQQGASLYGFDQPLLVEKAFKTGAVEALEFRHRRDMDVGRTRSEVIPEDDPFLPWLELFCAAREVLKPKTIVATTTTGEKQDLDVLERVSAVLHIPMREGRRRERIELTDRYVASLFDELQTLGEIQCKYLLAVMDEPTGAIVCVVSVEPLPLMGDLGSLPPEAFKALGLGTEIEILGLWDGRGRTAIEMRFWQNYEEFKDRALTLAQSIIESIGTSGE